MYGAWGPGAHENVEYCDSIGNSMRGKLGSAVLHDVSEVSQDVKAAPLGCAPQPNRTKGVAGQPFPTLGGLKRGRTLNKHIICVRRQLAIRPTKPAEAMIHRYLLTVLTSQIVNRSWGPSPTGGPISIMR